MSIAQTTKTEILSKLNWRYAVKQYDPLRKLSGEDWAFLEEAMTLAPSSLGLQPYKFIVVTDDETKAKLRPAAYGQPQITDASHIVVIAYKKTYDESDAEHFIDRIAEVRGQTRESLADYENTIKASAKKATDGGYIETWNSRQAYIALGFLLETAALLGIDATPMEGFDPAQFNEILGLTDYSAVAIAALGYRDDKKDWLAPLKKVRLPRHELVEHI
ncbi:NAD(P)H-dependent oxidoreductase [soil metagenome]